MKKWGIVILAFEKVLTLRSLFVFPRDNPQKNVVSLLTAVSASVFISLSDSTLLFSLHGSFKSHQHKALWLAIGIVSTNQVMVEWATMWSKINGTIWKSNKNWVRNWCQKWQTILPRVVVSWKNKPWKWMVLQTPGKIGSPIDLTYFQVMPLLPNSRFVYAVYLTACDTYTYWQTIFNQRSI